LQDTREANGFEAMLLHALGDPNPDDPLPNQLDLDALNADLASGDLMRTSQAQVSITTDLFMTVEAFGRLSAVRARSVDPNALQQPTTAEWSDVDAILITAQKEKRLYPTWLQQEKDAPTGVREYWTARKATLPLWRAASSRRAVWRQALELRSQAPLIDPDIIGPGDFRDPTSGPVFQRWLDRSTAISGWLGAMRNVRPNAPDLTRFDIVLAQSLFDDAAVAITRSRLQALREAKGLNEVLRELFGDPLPDLAALLAAIAINNVDASVTVAETLNLTIEGFQE
jgi:hypothetical protein